MLTNLDIYLESHITGIIYLIVIKDKRCSMYIYIYLALIVEWLGLCPYLFIFFFNSTNNKKEFQ